MATKRVRDLIIARRLLKYLSTPGYYGNGDLRRDLQAAADALRESDKGPDAKACVVIRDLLEWAVYDEERSDEAIAAVEAARAYLEEGC